MKFFLWSVGDPDTGIPGENATVEMEGWDVVKNASPATLEIVKEELAKTFGEIWHEKAYILTEGDDDSTEARDAEPLLVPHWLRKLADKVVKGNEELGGDDPQKPKMVRVIERDERSKEVITNLRAKE